jgi:effector-binding domain-containing protein
MIEVDLKTVESETVAYLGMEGSYAQIPEAMGRLYGWVAQHGLQPMGMPGAVYLTAPDEVPESEALWELQAALAGSPSPAPPDESGCGVRLNPALTVAFAMHRGPYETVGATYEQLAHWIVAEGYQMAGPPQELYLSDPNEVPPEEYLTEIRFPVTKG